MPSRSGSPLLFRWFFEEMLVVAGLVLLPGPVLIGEIDSLRKRRMTVSKDLNEKMGTGIDEIPGYEF